MASAVSTANADPAEGAGFLGGGGAMGARMRGFDWAGHPLGAPADWSPALKTTISLCLHSSLPSVIYWGPEFRLLYNDAWLEATAPPADWLGVPAAIARADVWPNLLPQFEQVLASGEGVSWQRLRMMLPRGGAPEETFWNYSSVPIRDADGACVGVFNTGTEVTAHVRAEQIVRASEERLQLALDASGHVGTWDWNFTTNRVTGDERIARFYGLDPAEARRGVSPERYLRDVHADDIEALRATLASARDGEGDYARAFRLVVPGAPERWLLAQGRSLHEGGELRHFAGVVLDITDTRRREDALRRARDEREFILTLTERQRALHDADDVMQITAAAVGERLGVNRAGFFRVQDEATLDYGACWTDGTLPPLTGTMPSARFEPESGAGIRAGGTLVFGGDAPGPRPNEAALTEVGTQAGIAVPLIRDGVWQAGFYLGSALDRSWSRAEIALVEEVAELCWDAVARVEATARLRALNASLAHEVADRTAERDRIWEVSRDLLGIADLDGRWLAVNPAWSRTLGWPAAAMLGRDSRWLQHPDDQAASQANVARVKAGEEVAGFENRYRTSAGEYRTLAWQATRAGERFYTVARDVTAERRQQAALLAAEERTRLVLEAMEGVGVWTYDIARDRFFSDPSFAALFGFDAARAAEGVAMGEVIARVHPEDLPKLRTPRDRRLGGRRGRIPRAPSRRRHALDHGARPRAA